MKKHFGITLFVFLISLLLFCESADAKMRFSKNMQGIDRKVTELMILAMQARDAGDYANAELFWMHARELKPSLPRPAWLDRFSGTEAEEMNLSDDEILSRIAALPYPKAKLLLEDQIRKSPGNIKLRQVYLDLARKNDDQIQINRHESMLEAKGSDVSSMVFRYIFFLILIVLLVWQLWAFVQDFRRKNSNR